MSDIPYPHKVEIWRTVDGSGGGSDTNLDDWGNPRLDPEDTLLVADDVPCWVQEKRAQERLELASLSEAGDLAATHTIFMEVRAFEPTDFLLTKAGGGQVGGERHRIMYPGNPDGGTDHLEVDTLLVTRGT